MRPGRVFPGQLLLVHGFRAEQLWKFNGSHDYVIGYFTWTGFDYLGESHSPGKGNSFRRAGRVRVPEGRLLLLPEPVDDPADDSFVPALELEGTEGKIIPVICYTSCDR